MSPVSRPPSRWSWRKLAPDRRAPAEPDEQVRARAGVRVAWLGGAIALCFLALGARSSTLMLLPDPQLEAKAKLQFEQSVEVRGRRGELLDRNGVLLATTVDLTALHADPSRLTDESAARLAEAVAPIVGKTAAEILPRLKDRARRDVLLGRGLTPTQLQQAQQVRREDRSLRNALFTRSEPRRFYPGLSEAASLLGMVGHNGRGAAGLERTWDHVLRGRTYKFVHWRDRKGRRVNSEAPEAEPGHSLVLTLDRRIQHATEEALDEAMVRTGAEAAFAVVVDVKTGEILALANRPTINTNDTSTVDMAAFKNRAVLDAYEPGSVFKPFVAAAAIEEGSVTPETIIDCENGAWAVGRRIISDDHPKGAISVAEVIKYSSNIGAAKLAFRIGADDTIGYLKDFGFGRYSGLNFPGETRGVIRNPATIKPIELATTSYGHGVSANALQLAFATATLANGGVRMEPRLVREIRDATGTVVKSFKPAEDRRVVSEETARATLDMMALVTQRGGTGTRAQVEGYTVAGKTGTAWKHVDGGYSATARIGSFVGTLPAEDPKVAIVLTVDTATIGSSYGGIVAGPGFAHIAAESMRVLGVAPNPPVEEVALTELQDVLSPPPIEPGPIAPAALAWTPEGSLAVPDLRGLSMRDALATLQGAGLALEIHGSGRVVEQHPAAGAPVQPGDQVEVTLQ